MKCHCDFNLKNWDKEYERVCPFFPSLWRRWFFRKLGKGMSFIGLGWSSTRSKLLHISTINHQEIREDHKNKNLKTKIAFSTTVVIPQSIHYQADDKFPFSRGMLHTCRDFVPRIYQSRYKVEQHNHKRSKIKDLNKRKTKQNLNYSTYIAERESKRRNAFVLPVTTNESPTI